MRDDFKAWSDVRSPPDRRCVFFDFQIVAERRDELKPFLETAGIEVKIKHSAVDGSTSRLISICRAFHCRERSGWSSASFVCPLHEKLTDEQFGLRRLFFFFFL